MSVPIPSGVASTGIDGEEGAGGRQAPAGGEARWARALVAAGLAAAVGCGAARQLGDFDLPWHLAMGRAMVAHRGVALADEYSYTMRGAPVRVEPIADLGLFLAERAGGPMALQLVGALLIAAMALAMVARGRVEMPGPRVGALMAGATTALGLVVAGPWLVVRPALASFALLAAALWLIDRRRRHRRPRREGAGQRGGTGRGELAALVALQLAWANVHGAAPLGAALLAGYAAYAAACRLARGRLGALLPEVEGERAGEVAAAALAGAAATCASPSGLSLLAEPLRVWGYGAYVTEWAPTSLELVVRHDPALIALVGLSLAALGVALGRARRGAALPSLWEVAVWAGALALAAARVRLIPLFAVAAAPLCARWLAGLVAGARLLPAAAVAVTLAAAPALLQAPGSRPGWGWDGENLPLAAVEFAAAHRVTGRLWNFLPFGGWVAFRLPEAGVFIDGRTAKLYPDELLAEYRRAGHEPAAFAALQQRWGFSWALVRARPGERFDEPIAADPAWRMVYLDDCAAIYVRAEGPNVALAAHGYQVLRHLTPAAAVLARFGDRSRAPDAAELEALTHDAALALQQAPGSLRAQLLVGSVVLARGDPAAAREVLARMRTIDSSSPFTQVLEAALSR